MLTRSTRVGNWFLTDQSFQSLQNLTIQFLKIYICFILKCQEKDYVMCTTAINSISSELFIGSCASDQSYINVAQCIIISYTSTCIFCYGRCVYKE